MEDYINQLSLIEEAMSKSKREGFNIACVYEADCSFYIYEIHYKKATRRNFKEFYSKRFYNWRKSNKELRKKIHDFLKAQDIDQAAHLAKERFKLNCSYLKKLKEDSLQEFKPN